MHAAVPYVHGAVPRVAGLAMLPGLQRGRHHRDQLHAERCGSLRRQLPAPYAPLTRLSPLRGVVRDGAPAQAMHPSTRSWRSAISVTETTRAVLAPLVVCCCHAAAR